MENFVKNMTTSDKLQYLRDSYNKLRSKGVVSNWTEFAALIPANRSCISSARGGDERYLTDNLIEKIAWRMKELESSTAVINSPGTIINGDNNNVEINQEPTPRISSLSSPYQVMKYVPTIPIHAYRAINFDVMEYFRNTHEELHMSPIVMQFPGTDCYYFVNSEDMSPNLRTNDLLCLSRLPDDAKVTNGDLCIINTKYQGILGRFVYDDGDSLILKSSQPRWTDMRIPKEEIFSVFRILGGIRTNI